jgi:hypothetical protein
MYEKSMALCVYPTKVFDSLINIYGR